jgi:hypothetical protein
MIDREYREKQRLESLLMKEESREDSHKNNRIEATSSWIYITLSLCEAQLQLPLQLQYNTVISCRQTRNSLSGPFSLLLLGCADRSMIG